MDPADRSMRTGKAAPDGGDPKPGGAFRPRGVPPAARKESPFKTKGNLYHGTIAFFEHNCPGGFVALVNAVEDPWLRHFLRQDFLAGGMYEVMVVPELIELEARVLRLDLGKYLDRRARWQAERDMSGVYRMLLKMASPEMVMARLPKVLTQTFNFGRATTTQLGPRHYRTEIGGIPAPLRYWLDVGVAVYSETALAAAGAKGVLVTSHPARPDGSQQGHPLVALSFECRWDA